MYSSATGAAKENGERNVGNNADCLPCGECRNCSGDVPTIAEGYIRPVHSSNCTITAVEVYACDPAGSGQTCKGKSEVMGAASSCASRTFWDESSDDKWCCEEQSAGHLCMSCVEDYFWKSQSSSCEPCTQGGKIARCYVPILSVLLLLGRDKRRTMKSRMQLAAFESDAAGVQRMIKARACADRHFIFADRLTIGRTYSVQHLYA